MNALSRAVALVAVVAVLHPVTPVPPAVAGEPAEGLPAGWTMTTSGPLGPADRDLLVRIRLAGLWEEPAGQQALARGVNPRVREIGQKISTEHHALDEQVRAVATRLGVPLPDQPNAQQMGWLAELSAARDAEFDRIFVDRLRAAHGTVFPVIAVVRAGTRNSAVRAFAIAANAAVLRHMGYLESTGQVDWAALPTPPAPQAAPATRRTGLSGGGGATPLLIWLVLIAAGLAAVMTTARVVRAR